MTPYKNLSGRSGIESYEITDDAIHVVFRTGRERNYLYTNKIPGKKAVDRMKVLAIAGHGLNSYISTIIRTSFERKW
ncbi:MULTISPECIES: hypothetical protein [Vibrio]|uniref:hypothetical protein n=1 Tax=Vibrio TaxID=662 RepID=UPI0009B4212D|nr:MULTISPECIES: hypothetical protein [Vibrio]EGQ9613077.1 hypothetical protein [Vibrio cholerae]EIJ0936093.1 hypothetical protein [Vibrio cholerae]PAR65469.1 hypothetical protein CGT89_16540 [Vibrio cholerae]PAR70532.1 hypothetical protein CGT88_18255 [Vibrio cholerae]RBM50402.1 hypothetical protein DLR64_12255 [Vibrio tarriae]